MIDGPLNRYAQRQERETDNARDRTVWLDIQAWTEHEDTLQPFIDCEKALNRLMRELGEVMDRQRDEKGEADTFLYNMSDLTQDAQGSLRRALAAITDEDI